MQMARQVYHKMSGGMERKTAASTVEALQILPQSMRAEIRWEAFSPVLLVHPLFFQYNTASHTAVRHVCTQALSEAWALDRPHCGGSQSAAAVEPAFFATPSQGSVRFFVSV